MNGLILIAQHSGMVGIGSHATDAEQNKGFQTADILISIPQIVHIVLVVSAALGGAGVALRYQLALFHIDPLQQTIESFVVKIYIGEGGKETLDHNGGGGVAEQMLVVLGRSGKTDQRTGQSVLQLGGVGLLAADTDIACAALAIGSLFTLKTKHNDSPL